MINGQNGPDHTPLYNLSSVLRETGLKADLVRAWENRYGVPKPQRSAGGHRLYSEYDIQTLKWLRARQAEGLSISSAVDLWNSLLNKGEEPLQGLAAQETTRVLQDPSVRFEILRDEWLAACIRFDGTTAENILNQAFSLYQAEQVCTGILQDGLRIMGERWFTGAVTVQQEHFASALAIRKLDAILAAAPAPLRSQTILVGCPAGEWHTFPSLLISVFLVRRGYRVVYLGANVPSEQLAETAETIRPDLVILSAQRLPTAATLKTAASRLRRFPLAFGGLIFNLNPELIPLIGGHFLGSDLNRAIRIAEDLLTNRTENPASGQISPEIMEGLDLFFETRGLIESNMNTQTRLTSGDSDSLTEINLQFGEAIAAALAFGNLDLLSEELVWVNRIIINRPKIANTLTDYLENYSRIAKTVMGPSGKLLTDWLDRRIHQFDSPNMEIE